MPDVLVNNAGTEIRKDVLKLSIAEFDKRHRHQPARHLSLFAGRGAR